MDTYTAKQRIFDRWAPSYDVPVPSVFYQAVHRRLLDHVEFSHQTNVLEIGCGTGKLLNRIALQRPDITGIGVDYSAAMIHQAKAANPYPDRLTFVQGDSHQLPFAPSQFDMAFCSISFLHYPNPVAVMQAVAQVLVPGGQFFLADFVPCPGSPPQVTVPVSPGGIRFYSAAARAALARPTGLICDRHVYLLGPVMLSCFHRSRL